MWGKNANGIAYHYFESMTDVNYVCGRRQRASSIQVDSVPKGLCPECADYYMKLPPHRRPVKAKPSPTPSGATAATNNKKNEIRTDNGIESQSQIGSQTADEKGVEAERTRRSDADSATVAAINRYEGTIPPPNLMTQEFETGYLTTVMETVRKQTTQSQHELDNLRQERRGLGNKQFTEGAIIAWKLEDRERTLEVLESMVGSPYFGRIDFSESRTEGDTSVRSSIDHTSHTDPANQPDDINSTNHTNDVNDTKFTEMIFIGRSTLEDPRGFLVYDWRAPICSMYYAYNTGKANYLAPMGTISGEILVKRQYEIKNGAIVSIYDSNGEAIARGEAVDEMLLSLLKRNSTGKMRQIVQSIQAEQDNIIRSGGDVVVVQGPAGSGKTIIALHRAAYLLYQMRLERERRAQQYGNISAQRMLVFSPNNVFADYISRVLPDLHEDQIRQVIMEQFLQAELARQLKADRQADRYRVETKADHYELTLEEADASLVAQRMHASGFKASPGMRMAIDLFLAKQESMIEEHFQDLELSVPGVVLAPEQRIFFTREEMLRHFRQGNDTNGVVGRIDILLNKIRVEIADYGRSPTVQTATTKRLERERQQLASRLRPFQTRSLMDLYRALWQSTDILEEAHSGTEVRPPRSEPHQETSGQLDDLKKSEGMTQDDLKEIQKMTLDDLKRGEIRYEDLIPLLLMCGYYRGFPAGLRETDHAVVDEAQDYSVLHYEYIKRCLPNRCSLTIVGDVNQAIDPTLNLHSYDVLQSIFPGRIKRLDLTKSYRSSMEITSFASRILRGGAQIDNVRRSGSKPVRIGVPEFVGTDAAIRVALEALSGAGYNTIAILCKTRREATALHRRLTALGKETGREFHLLTDGKQQVASGVVILPVPLAKGLEFDAVVLHDAGASSYWKEEERKFLYTACTRALHALYVCHSGPLSPLLDSDPELSDALYIGSSA